MGVHDGLHSVAGGVHKTIASASEVVDRCLSLIVGHSKRDGLVKALSLSAHSENCEKQQSRDKGSI